MKCLCIAVVCSLVLMPSTSAAKDTVPRLPESAIPHSQGVCKDPVTNAKLMCFVRKDGLHTYTIYRDTITGEIQRLTWSEALRSPETIWVRHGHDTF